MDDLALEHLRPDPHEAVGVRLAFDQPPQELVFAQKVLGLHEVDPQDALSRRETDTIPLLIIQVVN